MVRVMFKTAAALGAIMAAAQPFAASAQQGANPEWFVPGQQRPAAAAPRPAPGPGPRAPMPPQPMQGGMMTDGGLQGDEQAPHQQIQVQLPPAPEVPVLAKGTVPPTPIIGILSVQDVLMLSKAYQAADRELGIRRQKLNEDAQKEQLALRELAQALMRDRAKLTPEQIRAKEREYEERVNESRRKFGERNRIIQEAGQYIKAQIDRTLEQVAQQVALARGVNMVLNRAQLLGTSTEFDLTPQVAEVLNQVLPGVVIPPDGVSVLSLVPVPGTAGPGSIITGNGSPAPITDSPSAPVQAAPMPTPPKPPQKR